MGRMNDYVIEQVNEGNLVFAFGEYRPTQEYIDTRLGTEPMIDHLISKEQKTTDEFVQQRLDWLEETAEFLETHTDK